MATMNELVWPLDINLIRSNTNIWCWWCPFENDSRLGNPIAILDVLQEQSSLLRGICLHHLLGSPKPEHPDAK